jgi:hypothetical protein
MRNKMSGTTATSLSTPRRMDDATPNSLGFSVVNTRMRSGSCQERQKEGSDRGRSRVKHKESFDRKQSSNGANFEKITPNAPIRHRERSGLTLGSTRNEYCESRDTTGMGPGQSFSKEIRDTSMREEPLREVAPKSGSSKEEKIPAKSGPAQGEIEAVAMVDKEGRPFTRILIGRKRERLVIKKVTPKKMYDTVDESKGTTTKNALFRRKTPGSPDATNSHTPPESSIKMKRIRSFLSRPQRFNRSSSEKNASTTQHVHTITVALNQEAGQCEAKIPPRLTSEEGIELIALRTDADVDKAGAIFEMENLGTRDLGLAERLKQENPEKQKSKNHIMSSLSMTRSVSRKRSFTFKTPASLKRWSCRPVDHEKSSCDDASHGVYSCSKTTESEVIQKYGKEKAPKHRGAPFVSSKKDTTAYDIKNGIYTSAKHAGAEGNKG